MQAVVVNTPSCCGTAQQVLESPSSSSRPSSKVSLSLNNFLCFLFF